MQGLWKDAGNYTIRSQIEAPDYYWMRVMERGVYFDKMKLWIECVCWNEDPLSIDIYMADENEEMKELFESMGNEEAWPLIEEVLYPYHVARVLVNSLQYTGSIEGGECDFEGSGDMTVNGEVSIPRSTWVDEGATGTVTIAGTVTGSGPVVMAPNTAVITPNGTGSFAGAENFSFDGSTGRKVFTQSGKSGVIQLYKFVVDVRKMVLSPYPVAVYCLVNGKGSYSCWMATKSSFRIATIPKVLTRTPENSQGNEESQMS